MKAIIFDGDVEHLLNVDTFFQDPLIESLTIKGVIALYEQNKMFEYVIKDINESPEIMEKLIEGAITDEKINSVVKANELLEVMLNDMGGPFGPILIKSINKALVEYLKNEPLENDIKNI